MQIVLSYECCDIKLLCKIKSYPISNIKLVCELKSYSIDTQLVT